MLTLTPIGVSAEWKQGDFNSWRYLDDGGTFATGWRLIDGNWYCFSCDGYIIKGNAIDGWYLDENSGIGRKLTTSGILEFDKETGTIVGQISGSSTDSGQFVIPSTIDNVPVTRLKYGVDYFNSTSIIIPNTVKSIHSLTFCRNLKSIIIPDSVTTIETCAFSDCYSLTSITIPNSVTSIEPQAFSNCYNLTDVTIPDSVISIGYGVFSNCNNVKLHVSSEKIKQLLINAGVYKHQIILNNK